MRGFPGDRAKIVPERARRAPSRTSRHAQLSRRSFSRMATAGGFHASRKRVRARDRASFVLPNAI
jgi:hypothetical protein